MFLKKKIYNILNKNKQNINLTYNDAIDLLNFQKVFHKQSIRYFS